MSEDLSDVADHEKKLIELARAKAAEFARKPESAVHSEPIEWDAAGDNDASACPDLELLERLSAGELNPDEAATVKRHLDSCEACRTFTPESPSVSVGETIVCSEESTSQAPTPMASASIRTPPVPERIGQYEILEVLGRGGMGAVYKARHSKLDRIVALKVLSRQLWEDSRAVKRFQREMRAIGKLHHPNIVDATDAGEADGTHFLVMAYIDGVDVAALCRNLGPIPIPEACEIIRQAAVGLQHAHSRSLVHRDIKPSNLIIARHENDAPQVKVLDLGLALLEEPASPKELTEAGQLMGTVEYMAPEQGLDTHNVDIRADVYGLGATLHKLLTGMVPFPPESRTSVVQMMIAKTQQDAVSVATYRSDLPPELTELVDRMLARNPDDRPAVPDDVARKLSAFTASAI